VKVLIVNNDTKHLEKLCSLFEGNEVSIIPFQNLSPTTLGYDLIILSGGGTFSALRHRRLYAKELELIRTTHIPILGICLGFELICLSFDARLKRLPKVQRGIVPLRKIEENPLFKDVNSLRVYESHHWAVVQVPEVLKPLAVSLTGIEVIKHRNKAIYGFQFHPELCKESTSGYNIFQNLLSELAS
jgi:anthranilate/para-aminobenzoate synthase component II